MAFCIIPPRTLPRAISITDNELCTELAALENAFDKGLASNPDTFEFRPSIDLIELGNP